MHYFWPPAYFTYLPVKQHEDGEVGRMRHGGHRSGELGIWGEGSQGMHCQGGWGKGREAVIIPSYV